VLIQQLFNGSMLGFTYALITLGYALVFGSLAMLNMAHGETMMLGAFFGLVIYKSLALPFPLLLVATAVLSGLLGVFVYFVSFRFMNPKYELAPLISTLALAIGLKAAAANIFGSEPTRYPEVAGVTNFNVGPVLVSSTQVTIAITACVIFAALYMLLTRTRTGSAIRAISESQTAASLIGIRVERTAGIVFALSGALAGVGGVLIGLLYHAVSPWIGVDVGLKGVAIMILGGLGNLTGAVVGALLMGIVEALTAGYWGSGYRDAVVYLILILVLVLRPQGLFGPRVREERD
jgi:branched-chain amino acid transport system permease protein